MPFCQLQRLPNGRVWCPECDPRQVDTLRPRASTEAKRHCNPERVKGITDPAEVAKAIFDELPDGLPEDFQADIEELRPQLHIPHIAARATHYARALRIWVAKGCPLRTMEQAEACRQVCLECPSKMYDPTTDLCTKCGCSVGVSRFLPMRSKPRMATEKCHMNHWPE